MVESQQTLAGGQGNPRLSNQPAVNHREAEAGEGQQAQTAAEIRRGGGLRAGTGTFITRVDEGDVATMLVRRERERERDQRAESILSRLGRPDKY